MTGKRKKPVNPVVEMEWQAAAFVWAQDGVCVLPAVVPAAGTNMTSFLRRTHTGCVAVADIHFAQPLQPVAVATDV